jgi:hypothetical protein
MEPDDNQVGMRCRRPACLQLNLKAIELCIESFDTPYNAVAKFRLRRVELVVRL